MASFLDMHSCCAAYNKDVGCLGMKRFLPRNISLTAGWRGNDKTSREADRLAYFAAGKDYQKLCDNSALYLDSFLQVRFMTECRTSWPGM